MWTDQRLTLHRRSRLIINVTSMVDVLFILLIFFALSTTFDKYGAFDVNLPSSEKAAPPIPEKTHEIVLFQNDSVALDGVRMSLTELTGKVHVWPDEEKSKPVLLKADKKTPYGEVIRLLDDLRKEGVLKVQALTRNE